MIHLVIGGARSGKSRFAESQVQSIEVCQQASKVTYIATATADDHEMLDRISHHQKNRPESWDLIEEPFYLAQIIERLDQSDQIILIDCMTLWISNWLCDDSRDPIAWQKQCEEFLETLSDSQAKILIVSNEVGGGIVPLGDLSREFVDQAGWLNQKLSERVSDVTLVISGIPIALKTDGQYEKNIRALS